MRPRRRPCRDRERNLEHFAFGEGLGAELAPGGPQPDVLNFAWRDYGNRVGVWRLLDLFDELALPASVLVNSSIYGYCPEVMAAVRARGDEVVGHGRTNSERQGILPEAEERALIAETTRVIAAAEGTLPKGWLGPWISQSRVTPDLLAEAGYGYVLDWCQDDQPIWFSTRDGGRILSVPYPQELNDIPAIVARKDSASQFADMIIDNLDEMLEQATSGPLVMGHRAPSLHRRPALSVAPPAGRAPACRGASRGALVHHGWRHRGARRGTTRGHRAGRRRLTSAASVQCPIGREHLAVVLAAVTEAGGGEEHLMGGRRERQGGAGARPASSTIPRSFTKMSTALATSGASWSMRGPRLLSIQDAAAEPPRIRRRSSPSSPALPASERASAAAAIWTPHRSWLTVLTIAPCPGRSPT
jgi:hypothetical protein